LKLVDLHKLFSQTNITDKSVLRAIFFTEYELLVRSKRIYRLTELHNTVLTFSYYAIINGAAWQWCRFVSYRCEIWTTKTWITL